MRRLFTTTITMIAAVGLSAGAVAAGPERTVPIHEDLVGQMTGIDEADPFFEGSLFDGRCSTISNYVIRFEGTGTVSHLGRVTWRTEHCTQYFANTATDGVLTLVAANGDTLVQHYSVVIHSPTESTKTATFVDGTGRFATVSGGITSESVWYPDTTTLTFEGSGRIGYDASNRSNK
jgi:hypothetical protein